MKYSVVMPCYNESAVIRRSLAAVNRARRTRQDTQVIVVDNGSVDASADIARELACEPGDELLMAPGRRIAGVRNLGAARASGDILLFLDADMLVPENWLDALDIWFDDPQTEALGFVDLPPPEAPWYARLWGSRILGTRAHTGTTDFLPGRNIAVRRTRFMSVGGFDESLTTGEDKEFVMRLGASGARVVTDRSVELVHLGYEKTFAQWIRKEYWRQHSHLDLLEKRGLSLRLLRFPLIAVGHLLMALLWLLLGLGDSSLWGLVTLLWCLPSLLLALRIPGARRSPLQLVHQALLYWLRFHVAAVSIVVAALERIRAENTSP